MSYLVRFGRLISKPNKIFTSDNSLACKKSSGHLLNFISFSGGRSFSYSFENLKPFDESVDERKCQAKRSVLVQVNSDLSFPELYTYCSQYGNIMGVYHYTIRRGQQHFMLVEFETENEATILSSSCCFSEESDVIPVKSSFLWFRSAKNKNSGRKLTDILSVKYVPSNLELNVKNGCNIPTESDVMEKILKSENLSEQIQNLYLMTRLDDIGTRLRYMVARQIECALQGLYPDVTVWPFGSTVNGFGKMGCDLDLLLRYTDDSTEKEESPSRLVFHTKKSTSSGRMQQQRHMEIISDIIQLYLPGCNHVRKILQARIPIIKYNQEYVGVECDLSMASMTGVYMSELLYTFGCLDPRVRPLVFTVRKWAETIGITNPSPGRWITNFPLTLMVLFFLQNTNREPILPSFDYLKKKSDKNDFRLTDDLVNCTFVRDINTIDHKSNNKSTLEELLLQFFEFYAQYDFSSHAISLNLGRSINKPDHSALYIVNPLEVNLNVSKNVSFEECERLRIEVRNAAWQLESGESKHRNSWGLVSIFKQRENKQILKTFSSPRLVQVEDLFTEKDSLSSDDEEITPEGINDIKSEILQMSNKNKQINNYHYKNSNVKQQVNRIRSENENELRKAQKLIFNIRESGISGSARRKTRRK